MTLRQTVVLGMMLTAVAVMGDSRIEVAQGQRAVPTKASRKSPVVVERCRIKLMKDATLASHLTGILAFVKAEEGDTVKAGQKIAGLKDEIARAQFAIAEKEAENDVEVQYAEAAHQVAVTKHESSVLANKEEKGAVPAIEVLQLKLDAERARLQIEQAENQLAIKALSRDEAQAQLNAHQVEAPFDGVVTRVFKSKGEAVQQGEPILDVARTGRVKVEGYVDKRLAWTVKQGALVKVKLDFPVASSDADDEVAFEGRVRFVDVTVHPVTQKVRVWAEVADDQNILRAGLTATMSIYPDQVAAKVE